MFSDKMLYSLWSQCLKVCIQNTTMIHFCCSSWRNRTAIFEFRKEWCIQNEIICWFCLCHHFRCRRNQAAILFIFHLACFPFFWFLIHIHGSFFPFHSQFLQHYLWILCFWFFIHISGWRPIYLVSFFSEKKIFGLRHSFFGISWLFVTSCNTHQILWDRRTYIYIYILHW